MTTLEKIGILGIRSFSTESLEILAFDKPLTLIIGENGAGKTTIIECLKMATTGELPPNAGKGQNFIHNSNYLEIPEVKAQIRLVFKTKNKKKILISRSFQLLHSRDKKGFVKSSYKALDSVLQMKDSEGNVRSINKKCAQLDFQIPQIMGVSKTILENVIFCHQEESNWPLGDMIKLKKKFDDLFGATRYSKALDNINVLKKERQKIGKEKVFALEMMRTQIDQANSLKSKIQQCEDKDIVLLNDIEKLNSLLLTQQESLTHLKKKYDSLHEHEISLGILIAQKKKYCECIKCQYIKSRDIRLLLDIKKKEINVTYKNLSFSELDSSISNIKNKIKESEKFIDELEGQILCLQKNIDDVNTKVIHIQNQSLDSIRLQEQFSALENNKKTILNDIQIHYKDLVGENPDYFLYQLMSLKDKKKKDIQQLHLKYQDENTAVKKKIIDLEKMFRALTNDSMKCQNQIESNQITVEMYKNELLTEDDINQQINITKSELNNLLDIDSDNLPSHYDNDVSDLESLKDQRQACLRKIENISFDKNFRINNLNECNSIIEKQFLENKKKYLASESKIYKDLVYELYNVLHETVDESLQFVASQPDDFEIKYISHYKKEMDTIKEIGYLEGCLNTKVNFKELENTIDIVLENENINIQNFSSQLNDVKIEFYKKLKELLIARNAEILYNTNLKRSLENKKCSFCTRPLLHDEDVNTLKLHLENRISSFPQTLEEKMAHYTSAKNKLESYEGLYSKVIEKKFLESIKKTITNMEDKNITNHKLLLENLEILRTERNEFFKKYLLRIKLDMKLQSIKQLKEEISFHESIPLNASLNTESKIHNSSNTDVNWNFQSELSSIEERIRHQEKIISDKTEKKIDNIKKKHSYESKLSYLNEKLSHFEQIKSKLKELERTCVTLKLKFDEQEKSLEELTNSIQKLKEQENSLQMSYLENHKSAQIELQSISQLCEKLETIQTEYTKVKILYESLQPGINCNLEELQQQRDHDVENLKNKKDLLENAYTSQKENKNSLEILQVNLELSELKHEYNGVNEKIESINKEMDNESFENFRMNIDKLAKEVNKFNANIAQLQGERKSNQEWKQQHEIELQSDKYLNIDQKLKDAIIETETELMAIRDLQKYYNALDKALMRYHSVKIQDINRSIRELWQTTYKGNDIDSIALRSNTEEDSNYGASGQRSYNYRVIMVKEGIEMEMRGRCSAGQKVLASIVIRLALAESFSMNCGILALDEPTTNLDQNNMAGLARSIADLIEARRNHANFQLILITHDEEFVRMLARHQPCDSFFRVKKNTQGLSTIRRADIRTF